MNNKKYEEESQPKKSGSHRCKQRLHLAATLCLSIHILIWLSNKQIHKFRRVDVFHSFQFYTKEHPTGKLKKPTVKLPLAPTRKKKNNGFMATR